MGIKRIIKRTSAKAQRKVWGQPSDIGIRMGKKGLKWEERVEVMRIISDAYKLDKLPLGTRIEEEPNLAIWSEKQPLFISIKGNVRQAKVIIRRLLKSKFGDVITVDDDRGTHPKSERKLITLRSALPSSPRSSPKRPRIAKAKPIKMGKMRRVSAGSSVGFTRRKSPRLR